MSDGVAQDKSWFDPLFRDLNDGGKSEFLNLLLTLQLRNWHPREVPKTTELAQQQVLTAGSVEQWLLACVDVDAVLLHLAASLRPKNCMEPTPISPGAVGHVLRAPLALVRYSRKSVALHGGLGRICAPNENPAIPFPTLPNCPYAFVAI